MDRCVSGKRMYPSQEVAENVLIEAWARFGDHGPMSVYLCEDCDHYHLTSRGPMNDKLSLALREGKIQRAREANRWAEKFKRK